MENIQETKREKFVRLAEGRVNNILENIRKLGNLSNRNNYEYSDADIKKIFAKIAKEINRSKLLFGNGAIKNNIFKL